MRNNCIFRILYQHEAYRLAHHHVLTLCLPPLFALISGFLLLTVCAYPTVPVASPVILFGIISLVQFFVLPSVAILGFAHETQQHIDTTLLIWPVNTRDLVWAKCAAWGRFIVFNGGICFFWLIVGRTWYHYDIGILAMGAVQLCLTALLTLCMALYFSCRMPRTWQAVFTTQCVLLMWLLADGLCQKPAWGFMHPIVSPFTYSYYTHLFQRGVLTSGTLTFFVGISAFFLRRSGYTLEARRGHKTPPISLVACLVWVLTLFYPLEIDITRTGLTRLHTATYRLLKHIKDPLYLTYYYPPSARFHPDICAVREQLRLYPKAHSGVVLHQVALPSEQEATKLGLINQKGLYAGLLIEYRDKGALIPLLLDADEVEYDIASKLYQILYGRKRVIFCLQPEQTEGYTLFARALSRHFDVQFWQQGPLPPGDVAFVFSAASLNSQAACELMQAHQKGLPIFMGYSGIGIPLDEQKPPKRYGNIPLDAYGAELGLHKGSDLVLDPEGFPFAGQHSANGQLVQQNYAPWPKGYGSAGILWRLVLPIFSTPLHTDKTWTPLLYSSVLTGLQEGPVNLDPVSLGRRPLPTASGSYILIAEKNEGAPFVVAGSEHVFSNLAPTLQNYIAGELLTWKLLGQEDIAQTKLAHLESLVMKRPYSALLDTGRIFVQIALFVCTILGFVVCTIVRRLWFTKPRFLS